MNMLSREELEQRISELETDMDLLKGELDDLKGESQSWPEGWGWLVIALVYILLKIHFFP